MPLKTGSPARYLRRPPGEGMSIGDQRTPAVQQAATGAGGGCHIGMEVGPTSAFCRRIPAGVHGRTSTILLGRPHTLPRGSDAGAGGGGGGAAPPQLGAEYLRDRGVVARGAAPLQGEGDVRCHPPSAGACVMRSSLQQQRGAAPCIIALGVVRSSLIRSEEGVPPPFGRRMHDEVATAGGGRAARGRVGGHARGWRRRGCRSCAG